jgi:GT2 family glycosyltransferase
VETPFDREGSLPAELQAHIAQAMQQTAAAAIPARDKESPFVSVVIATHDRPGRLVACLDSLLRQDYPHFDVIVVDNAPSSSETAELIASRYAPTGRVRYLREDTPGLGRAHNRGLAHVAAPIVAFTDDDVIVDSRWLTSIASQFMASDAIGCVTGLILPAELETRAQYWAERHGGFGKGIERRLYDLGPHRPAGRLYPYAAGQLGSGANMAFRTDALRRIGGFDPALGAGTLARGGDDLGAFFAVIQAGYQLAYEPGAIVWHHHRAEEAGMRRQAFGYGVGLGAYLTKLVLDHPRSVFRLALAVPAGVAHLLSASSPKNRRLADDYPTALVWRERFGILAGVPLYLLSRVAARRATKGSIEFGSGPLSSAAD